MPFEMNSLYVWVAVIIISVGFEAFSLSLSSIWFGVGALAALIAASIGLNLSAQLLIFVIFSAALLILVRPFCRRFLRSQGEATNADRIVGESAIVTEEIDNVQQTGAIKIFGQLWTARSTDDAPIPVGATVRVVEIKGVKAIVEKN